MSDDNAKALQLQSGELNLSQVTPKDAQNFANSDTYRVYDMKTSDYRGILYNFANEYWQKNADLIPGINYAIDRQAIVDAVLLGHGEVAYGPLQRNIYNYEDVEYYEYDPEKAAQVFEAAGCTKDADGYWCRDGERIGFTINASSTDQVRIDMAQIAAQQLQAVGLDVKANVRQKALTGAVRNAASLAGDHRLMRMTIHIRYLEQTKEPIIPVIPIRWWMNI